MDLFTLVARLSLDASDYETGIDSAKTSSVSAAQAVEKVAESAKKVDQAVKAAADAVNNMSESTEKAEDTIQAVGDATEQAAEVTKKSYRELQSDAMKLALQWEKAGMSASDARKKAYAELAATGEYETKAGKRIVKANEEIAESNEEVAESYENVGDAARKTGDQCEKAAEKQKSPWMTFRERVDKTGDSFEKITAKAVAFGTLVAHAVERAASALIDFGKNAIQASADIEAEISLYKQVFGDLEAAATGALESISQDTNILATRLRGIGTGAFMQFKGAGVDAGNALSMMDKYTRLAADAAAAYNISVEEADQKLRSFIRGNTEAGDSIGLFTSESQRNERALANYGKKWTELTEAQKQMLMLGVVEEIYNQTEVVGQAAREGHEWENVIGNLNTAFSNLSATVGSPFREALIPVIEKLTGFLSDETITLRFGMIAASIGNLAGKAFDGAINLIDGLIKWSNGEDPGEGFQIIEDIFSTIANITDATFGSVKSIVDAITGLMGGEDSGSLDDISEFFKDLKQLTESEEFQTAADVIIGIGLALMVLTSPVALVGLGVAFIVTNWKDVKKYCKEAWDTISEFCNTVFVDPISSILGGIESKLQSIVTWANNAAGAIASFFGFERSDYTPSQSTDEYFAKPPSSGGEYDNGWGNDYDTGRGGAGRSFATGLDYVPNDNFRARLHEGEAVLTKAEAADWRRGGSVQAIDYYALGSAVGSAVREALEGIGLYTDDGTRIADMVTRRVSRNIARESKNRRFSPVV